MRIRSNARSRRGRRRLARDLSDDERASPAKPPSIVSSREDVQVLDVDDVRREVLAPAPGASCSRLSRQGSVDRARVREPRRPAAESQSTTISCAVVAELRRGSASRRPPSRRTCPSGAPLLGVRPLRQPWISRVVGAKERRVAGIDDQEPHFHDRRYVLPAMGEQANIESGTRFTRRSATFIGSFTLAARIVERLGAFGQIALIASAYGSSYIADRYFIASIVPLIIGSIAGEALSANILPALVRRNREQDLVSGGLYLAALGMAVVTLLYVVLAYWVVHTFAPAGSRSLDGLAGVRPDRRAARPLRLPRQRVDLLRALCLAAVSQCRRHRRRVRGDRRRAARDAVPRLGRSCGVVRLRAFVRAVVAGGPPCRRSSCTCVPDPRRRPGRIRLARRSALPPCSAA